PSRAPPLLPPPFPTRRSSDLKLRGLQFRVDMERRRAKSPMAACIAISAMMHDSFDQLRQALNEAAGNATVMGGSQHDTMTEAKVDRKSTRLNSSHVKISYAVF